MSVSWAESYVGQLREKVGHIQLIVPSIRAILRNERGEILFIDRRGENSWGMPAGSIELNESITDCLKREVFEETGLIVEHATPISLYSGAEHVQTNHFGDAYQMFEFVFLVEQWSGEIVTETDETTDAKFFPPDQLPPIDDAYWLQHTIDVLKDLKNFRGSLILK
ncbi:NUDIX domain-containing protein [Tumebacillus lipolyticus]|uniref:NUDIX domain-containing protein n=1 Tax=Tumebacillus lipolyticus TaxID=1280370 RepID=A0ABW4ZZU3_9BACL